MSDGHKMLLNPFSCLQAAWTAPFGPTDTYHSDITCRVCLSFNTHLGLFPISSETKQLLFEMFTINIEDNETWKICISCLKFIVKAAKFRETAKMSDSRLKFVSQRDQKVLISPTQVENEKITDESRTIPCTESGCTQKFSKPKYLLMHQRRTHKIHCKSNEKMNPEPKPLKPPKSHSNDAQETKTKKPRTIPFTEPSCTQKFSEPKFLLMHQQRNHIRNAKKPPTPPPTLFQKCKICREKFHTEEEFIQHRSTHKRSSYVNSPQPPQKESDTFKCPQCSKTFSLQNHLGRHMTMAHSKNAQSTSKRTSKFNCGICHKKFPERRLLVHHQAKAHAGVKLDPHTCNICGKEGFKSRLFTYNHKRKEHSELYK